MRLKKIPVHLFSFAEPCAPLNISVKRIGMRFYINWTEIDDECKNGAITSHILYLEQQFDNGTIIRLREDYQNDSQAIDYEMSDVYFGVRYLIAVAGITQAGIGEISPWANVTRGVIGMGFLLIDLSHNEVIL